MSVNGGHDGWHCQKDDVKIEKLHWKHTQRSAHYSFDVWVICNCSSVFFLFCFNWVLVYRYQILGMRHNQICYILATSTCTAGHCKINHIPQNCSAMTETSQKQTRNNQNPVPLPWLSSSVMYEFIGCGWAVCSRSSELLSTPTRHCSTVAHSDQTFSLLACQFISLCQYN